MLPSAQNERGRIMNAFVTGGSGFVGRNLIEELVKRGDEVRALARSDMAADTVNSLGAEPVRGDLQDVDAMREGMQGCDVAFHAAAVVALWGDPEVFHRVNVDGTKNVIQCCRDAGVPRLVHVGTEAILADGSSLANVDETRPVPEKPYGLYPLTKGKAERIVREANDDQLTTVAIRPPLIWGKGDTSVLPQIVQAVKDGRWMWFNGGHYPHTTTHVKNVVEGLLKAAEKGRGGEVYFITDGEPPDFRWFMTEQLKTQGVDPGNRSIPYGLAWAFATACDVVWDTFNLKSDPPLARSILCLMGGEVSCMDRKAREELGYEGNVSHEQGLAEMAADPS